MKKSIRKPAVAGIFYPSNSHDLTKLIGQIENREARRINLDFARHRILGGVVPHAGYIYSGYQAVHFFKILQHSQQPIDTVVIVNPNHKGYGPPVAVDIHDFWETPFGLAEVDTELADLLELPPSADAHSFEHSGEVLVPFIQHYLPQSVRIVPISILQQSYQQSAALADKLYKAIIRHGKHVIVVASSDFSHFVSPQEGQRLDRPIIDKALTLDAEGIDTLVKVQHSSICGYGAIMTLIEYAKRISEKAKGEILSIGHSGEIHPSDSVVHYVSMIYFQQ